jgi:hypothetical protein
MAMPTKEKTWQYNVNQLPGGGSKPQLLAIKNSLTGFGVLPWTVWGSCNATLYGNNDGVNRWITTGDLNWVGEAGSTTRSWIVLKQTGLGVDASICYEMNTNSATQCITVVVFPTGPSVGGTTLVRPSAANEVVLLSAALWGGSGTSTVIHAAQSTDGQCTRLLLCRLGFVVAIQMFDRPKSPVDGWSPAIVMLALGTNASATQTTYALLNDSAASKGRIGSVASTFYMTSEGWGASTLGEQMTFPDDDTAEYPLSPAYLASDLVGVRGMAKGRLYDLWWGSTAVANGSTYPSDGSKAFAQFGHLIFPWDGSTPLIT